MVILAALESVSFASGITLDVVWTGDPGHHGFTVEYATVGTNWISANISESGTDSGRELIDTNDATDEFDAGLISISLNAENRFVLHGPGQRILGLKLPGTGRWPCTWHIAESL